MLTKKTIEKLNKISKYHYSSKYYDKQGNVIGMGDWANLFEDFTYKRIDLYQNVFIRISTVWLGLDHSFDGEKPLIFETMIFPLFGNEMGCWRYSTLQEAIDGHNKTVKKYKYRIDLVVVAILKKCIREIQYKYWNIKEWVIKYCFKYPMEEK